MSFSVTAGKHLNNIRVISRQQSITTMEGFFDTVFSVGSAPRLYSENPGPAEVSGLNLFWQVI
jgi:hypothetical protein